MVKLALVLSVVLELMLPVVWAADFFVAPNGTSSGLGTLSSPWDLATAIADNTKPTNRNFQVKPGDTIYLRRGTYVGVFTSALTGTAAQPILVKNYPGELPVLDGNDPRLTSSTQTLTVAGGGYVWFQGFEVTNTNPQRFFSTLYVSAPDGRAGGVSVVAPGVKLINLVVHDTSDGITAWVPATDFEAYGNLIFNVGWDEPDGHMGHGIYTQNSSTTKLFENNISANNFKFTAQLYGKQENLLNNFIFRKNIFFNPSTIMFGGSSSTALNNIVFEENYLFNNTLQIGYMNAYNRDIYIRNNYISIAGDTMPVITLAKQVTIEGNSIFSTDGNSLIFLGLTALPDNTPADFSIDNNRYSLKYIEPGYGFYVHNGGTQGFCRSMWFSASSQGNLGRCTPETAPVYNWKELGFDTHSSLSYSMPTEPKIVVQKKDSYDPKRAHVAIYNWGNGDSVRLSHAALSGLLASGDSYEVRSALDYFGDLKTGVYDGQGLTISMRAIDHTVAKPIGFAETLGPSTFPEFGAFVLINTGNAPLSPLAPSNLRTVNP